METVGHDYLEDWTYDEERHWHACKYGCGAKSDEHEAAIAGFDVLMIDEWVYLLGVRNGYDQKYGLATANAGNVGVKGIVLLLDSWSVMPEGCSAFAPGKTNDRFGANSYTLAQWELMEAAGAVFLPASGYYDPLQDVVNDSNFSGCYYFVTPGAGTSVRGVCFISAYGVTSSYGYQRNCGRSVRLVKRVAAN